MSKQEKYIGIFKEEADEHLTSLSLGLLELEQRSDDEALIHELLRNAHTLKGSAKMLGFAHIGDVAHVMEDIFKAVEDGELPINPSVIDVLLNGADVIKDIIDKISGRQGEDIDVDDMVAALKSALKGEAPAPAKKEPPDTKKKPVTAKPAAKKSGKKKSGHKKTQIEPPASIEETPEGEPKLEGENAKTKNEPAQPKQGPQAATRETIRVDTRKLDDLLNLAGELLINKIKLDGKLHQLRAFMDSIEELIQTSSNGGDQALQNRAILERYKGLKQQAQEIHQAFNEDLIELDFFSQEIRNQTFSLRVLPASTLFDEFQRTVRDFSRELHKDIRLEVTGGETELDKQLLEELRPALIHMVRNSCDHGIEPPDEREAVGKNRQGTIHINAYHKGHNVIIEITDDGRGIDPDVIRQTLVKQKIITEETARTITDEDALYFIFQPGFTTAPIITDLSGRGVGMDVVKTNIERIKGDLTINTEKGKFTKITLTAPLTLSIMNSLLVTCGDNAFAVPLTFVAETARLPLQGIFTEAGRDVFNLRGQVIPLIRLDKLLGIKKADVKSATPEKIPVVILKHRNQNLGLIVDAFLRDQEIVVKNMGNFLKEVPFASGVTILRQGEPTIILNVFDIYNAAERTVTSGLKEQMEREKEEVEEISILVVDDSITTRIMEKSILEAAGYNVELAVSGEEAQEKLAQNDYHLMVTDVEMPGIDGFELTQRARQLDKTKELPVIICTSLANDEHKRRGIEVGAQAYIVKGTFDQAALLDTVKRLVG